MPGDKQNRDDWNLCQRAWKALVERHGDNPAATDFTPREFVVVAVWTVSGIVGNGGFEYLFESDLPGDLDYQLSLAAFRMIGCDEAVAAFEGALRLFPGGSVPRDCAERARAFAATSEDVRTRLATRFWAADEDMVTKLAAYIRRELPTGRLRADFNGVFRDVLCLSHSDECLDESGASVTLKAGMVVTAFDDDVDEAGQRDDLLATGIVEPAPDWLSCRGSRWVLRLDERGVRHESDDRKGG
jgi:hypothetical protein